MLSASTVRNLGQKEYEKRKSAALEVETMVRDLRDSGDFERIGQLIVQLIDDLAASPQPNVRKGALHALAGTAIGLRQDVDRHLAELLRPVLASFSDQDPRVRYYGRARRRARCPCKRGRSPLFTRRQEENCVFRGL